MMPRDPDAGHCFGENCFSKRPPDEIDACVCDCPGCVEAIEALLEEQDQDDVD